MRILIVAIGLFSTSISFSQEHPTCDGVRYIDDVFTSVNSTMGIMYGEGTTIGGNLQELYMDVFEPMGDQASKRPVIIFAFGGSFIGGEKEDVSFICERYARKGFVAVALNYRLYDLPLLPLPTEQEMKVVVTKAVADFKGVTRFLRNDAATTDVFKIDPDFIFVGGVSAGAIAAAHAADLDETDDLPQDIIDIIADEGGLEGSVNDLNYSSEVQGLINFSGGLNEAKWLDANDPPFLSVHENGDGTVPYGDGFANIFGVDIIALEGSASMKIVADSVGVKNYLHTIDANSHVGYLQTTAMIDEVMNLSSAFLHDLMCDDKQLVSNEDRLLTGVSVYPNPTNGQLFLEHDYGDRLNVQLFNLFGQSIATNANNYGLDLSSLESGIYYIQIAHRDSKKFTTRKVVVN